VVALFWPDRASALETAAVRIAALAALVLAGLGYGRIEADLDAKNPSRENDSP